MYKNTIACLLIAIEGGVDLQGIRRQMLSPEALQIIPCHREEPPSILVISLPCLLAALAVSTPQTSALYFHVQDLIDMQFSCDPYSAAFLNVGF